MSRRLPPAVLVLLAAAASLLRAEPPRFQVEHKSPLRALAWSADGQWLAAGAEDGTVQVVESATGKEVHRLATGHPVAALAFAPDGKTLALSQVGESLSAWDVAGGKRLRVCPFRDYKADHLAFTADGQTVMAAGAGEFQQWRQVGGSSGSKMANVPAGCSAVAPDGRVSAWSDDKGTLRLREYDPNRVRTVALQVGLVRSLALGPETKLLALGGDKGVHLWDLAEQKPLAALPGLHKAVDRLSFAADGRTVAALTEDGASVYVWDLTHSRLRRQLTHNRGKATALALSPDGKWLATVGAGGKALLVWNATARELTHKGPPLELSAKELAGLWADLASPDPNKADAAWIKLGAAGDNAVPFLQEQIRPIAAPALDRKYLAKLLADLDADRFADRERASKELTALGELAVAPLERLLEDRPSIEAERRARLVLERLAEPVPTPDRLRALEAVGLLEQVRTAKSLALLREIEREALVPQIRQEARQALQRLTQAQAEKK